MSTSTTPTPSSSSTPSIIAPDVKIDGSLTTTGELQLDGTINGDLTCSNVVMGESGSVKGVIKSDRITIRGYVKGEVHSRTVKLEKSAVIEGDIYHENLSVESGARITGHFAHSEKLGKESDTANVSSIVKKDAPKPAE